MNATFTKRSHDRTDDDPEATHASIKQAAGTPTPPKHPNITSNDTNRDS
jgi:hypothetical protein